ncbi:hypothetical protein [Marinoscillum pacificum]|uniref:hypothetical protein n=1 Tax=Marinoscillum pacificum TaxID=392723 RepID=UPI002158180A|nr:hypothetical protein [Marinoscillum pacificum]
MKARKYPTQSEILNATKIEVFHVLNENFGSTATFANRRANAFQEMNFKLDRLFSVIHNN